MKRLLILIARGWTPYDVLTKALVAGMTIVGADFRDGILFVPEVLMSGNHAAIARWRRKQALGRTQQRRPDLLAEREARQGMSADERALLDEFRAENSVQKLVEAQGAGK